MKLKATIAGIIILVISVFACGCNEPDFTKIIRIHIRANSNGGEDQSVKYYIKEEIVRFITPLSEGISDKEQMYCVLEANLNEINELVAAKLNEKGFDYSATAIMTREKFPARYYGDIAFPSGEYDALIITLGEGKGDNWWCVAFPPLCFVGAEDKGGDYFKYKSKIYELLNG
ncbi:MAG: stage II sporulation protein R [Christensenellales bacterium]|jgi:stage II sporulation protein R